MSSIQILLVNSLNVFFNLLQWLVIIRILLSWVPMAYNTGIGRALINITEPILGPVRNMVDRSPIGGGMGLDFSPVFALILMSLVHTVLEAAVLMIF